MAEQISGDLRLTGVSLRVPVEPRAIGAMLARAGQLRGMQLLVETDRHGNTRAYMELQRA